MPFGGEREVLRQDRHGVAARVDVRVAPDEGVGGRERGGIRGVLEEPPLHVQPADVDRQASRCEDRRERQHEDDEDLPTLADARTPSPGLHGTPRHQLMTIVTSPPRVRRPLASLGRRLLISGSRRSWW